MKNFLKKNRNKIIIALSAVIVLTLAFFAGGSITNSNDNYEKQISSSTQISSPEITEEHTTVFDETTEETSFEKTSEFSENETKKNEPSSNVVLSTTNTNAIQSSTASSTVKDKYKTDPIPEGKPEPVEPQEQETKKQELTCTFSISCASIFNNLDKLEPEKLDILPDDGCILKTISVVFNEGESVFDILKRVCKENKIHMEFSTTPIYNSAYIEGVNNLYEFDCGSLSGWMYSVNDWFPNYGCSRYQVKDGDAIEFSYTCDLGCDIGGDYAYGQQNE